MLRTSHRPGAADADGEGSGPVVRPRVAQPSPVFDTPVDETMVVRGRLRTGGAAALILESTAVCVVSADRASRCRLRRFTIREVLSVEQHRTGATSEVAIVTATASVAIVDADTALAWTFCRELRSAILMQGKASAG